MPSLLFSLLLHLSSLFALPSIPSPSLFLQGYPLLKDSHSQINSETLNTLTHLSAIEVQEVLQEVVSIAGSQDGDTEGFIGKLSIYNNEEMTKGYAYSAKGSKAEQGGKDTYAFIRGKTAENIFALKNYANTNTNTLTNTEWNTKYQSSKVFKQGNQLNKETWQRNAEGIGERDNLAPALLAIPAYEAAVAGVGIVSAYTTHKLLKDKTSSGGISIDEGAKGLGVVYYTPPPKEEEIKKDWIPDLQNLKKEKSKSGRARWKDDDKIYEWDSQHGELEIYDKRGKHQGSINPKNGKTKKPQNRRIDP